MRRRNNQQQNDRPGNLNVEHFDRQRCTGGRGAVNGRGAVDGRGAVGVRQKKTVPPEGDTVSLNLSGCA